jgi:hypothetical protein
MSVSDDSPSSREGAGSRDGLSLIGQMGGVLLFIYLSAFGPAYLSLAVILSGV